SSGIHRESGPRPGHRAARGWGPAGAEGLPDRILRRCLARFVSPFLEAFREGLRELCWAESRNFVIEYRSGAENAGRLSEVAAELVRHNVDLIVATSPPSIWPVKETTKTIPIVMVMVMGPDPVESGLVQSLAHPGGNITGLTTLSADLSV